SRSGGRWRTRPPRRPRWSVISSGGRRTAWSGSGNCSTGSARSTRRSRTTGGTCCAWSRACRASARPVPPAGSRRCAARRARGNPPPRRSALVGDLIRWPEDRLGRERELLDRLRALDASEPDAWRDVLRVVALMQGLGSPSPARRQQTLLGPAGGGDGATELLAEAGLAESDPHVAGDLGWARARSGGRGVAAALGDGPCGADGEGRRRAVLAVVELGEAPGASELLADALDDEDATVRGSAALALG